MSALVVGAGVFGVTAALELRARGHDVTLLDQGSIPHPLAESTDITKVIRADYGSDALYTGLMERALERWRDWNSSFARGLFHECGVLFVARRTMAPGQFEHDTFHMLTGRGHRLERLGGQDLANRFPGWNGNAYVDGYFNPLGGYAESGAVVSALTRLAKDNGVAIRESVRIATERESHGRIAAVVTEAGEELRADLFVYTVGSWIRTLVPALASAFRATGHPVVHLAPPSLEPYREDRFPVFGADISQTGLYGFPAASGVVKVARHGPGRVVDPSSQPERTVSAEEEATVRAALSEALPALGGAKTAATRICVYSDTADGDLWIAADPERPNRVVATGGSGHAFKFAPVLGELIADACVGSTIPRFSWRPSQARSAPSDAARQR